MILYDSGTEVAWVIPRRDGSVEEDGKDRLHHMLMFMLWQGGETSLLLTCFLNTLAATASTVVTQELYV